jgi:excisionase family DNA binding protein
MPTPRRRVNVTQAMAIAGVSRRTIYGWVAANKVEHTRTAGGHLRIYADTLLKEPTTARRRIPPAPSADEPLLPFPEGPLVPPSFWLTHEL